MRVLRFAVKPVAVLALFAGTVAVAGDLAKLEKFDAVCSTPLNTMLCVVPSDAAVGQVCNVSANGVPVACVVLQPGTNYVVAPSFGPSTCYVASGPGIEGKWYNPGSN